MTERDKTISIPRDLHLKLKYKALEENCSMKEFVVKIIEESLDNEKGK